MFPKLFLSFCLLVVLQQPPATNAQRPHEGIHLNFLTQEGLDKNLLRHKDAFEAQSGATLRILPFPSDEVFDQIMGDLVDGSPLYDGFVFPPDYLVDFVSCEGCSLEILSERVRNSDELAVHEVFPYFRSANTVFNGEVYAITLDGDVHYMYYNSAILESLNRAPPVTWEEYLEIAELGNGRDYNSDGVQEFGSCIIPFQFFLFTVVSSFMQSKGTSQGIFFDVDTMDPLIDTDAFREGLALYMKLREIGDGSDIDSSWPGPMAEDRCALMPIWGDVSFIARDSKGLNTSTWDKLGVTLSPGLDRVFDFKEKVWHNCREKPEECPKTNEEMNFINHAPMVTGGWSGGLPANIPEDRKDAAFDFIVFLSRNSDVDVMAGTGFEPYRESHFDLDLWVNSGFNEESAKAQIAGMKETLSSNNLVMNLRIQGTNEYTNVVFGAEMALLIAGEITQEEFISRVTAGWQEITDRLGRRKLLQQYRATIGLPPKDFAEEVDVTRAGRITIAVISGIFALCCIGLMAFIYINLDLKVWRYASPLFLFGSLVGALISYVGVILMSADASTGTCTSALWLYVVGMSLLLGNIFAKTYRTWRLFSNRSNFFLVEITDAHILPISVVVMGLAIVVLIVWTVMDAPTSHRSTKGVDDLEYVIICDSTEYGTEFFATIIAYFGVLLLVALFLSFNTRNVGDAFNESKVLSLCVYNLTQVLIIVVVCALALDSPDARYILIAICLLFGVTVTIGLLFLPKIWTTLKGKGDDVSTKTKSSGVATGASAASVEVDN